MADFFHFTLVAVVLAADFTGRFSSIYLKNHKQAKPLKKELFAAYVILSACPLTDLAHFQSHSQRNDFNCLCRI